MNGTTNKDGMLLYHRLLTSLNRNDLSRRMPYRRYWYDNFEFALEIIREAADCFDSRCYEASTVLCRTAIDSFLLTATNDRILVDCKVTDEEGGVVEHISETRYVLDHVVSEFSHRSKEIPWGMLKEMVIGRGILREQDINEINTNVRQKGNFSAHLIEYQIRNEMTWKAANRTKIEDLASRLDRGESLDLSAFPHGPKKMDRFQRSTDAS